MGKEWRERVGREAYPVDGVRRDDLATWVDDELVPRLEALLGRLADAEGRLAELTQAHSALEQRVATLETSPLSGKEIAPGWEGAPGGQPPADPED